MLLELETFPLLIHELLSLQIPNHVVLISPTVIRLSSLYVSSWTPRSNDLLNYHSKQCFEICLSPLVMKYAWQKICKGRELLFKMMSNACELHQN